MFENGNNNDQILLGTLHIKDTVPSILYIVTHLIFTYLHEVGTIIAFFLQTSKLRHSEAELLVKGVKT